MEGGREESAVCADSSPERLLVLVHLEEYQTCTTMAVLPEVDDLGPLSVCLYLDAPGDKNPPATAGLCADIKAVRSEISALDATVHAAKGHGRTQAAKAKVHHCLLSAPFLMEGGWVWWCFLLLLRH